METTKNTKSLQELSIINICKTLPKYDGQDEYDDIINFLKTEIPQTLLKSIKEYRRFNFDRKRYLSVIKRDIKEIKENKDYWEYHFFPNVNKIINDCSIDDFIPLILKYYTMVKKQWESENSQ